MAFSDSDQWTLDAIRDALMENMPEGLELNNADVIRHCITVTARHHGVV